MLDSKESGNSLWTPYSCNSCCLPKWRGGLKAFSIPIKLEARQQIINVLDLMRCNFMGACCPLILALGMPRPDCNKFNERWIWSAPSDFACRFACRFCRFARRTVSENQRRGQFTSRTKVACLSPFPQVYHKMHMHTYMNACMLACLICGH